MDTVSDLWTPLDTRDQRVSAGYVRLMQVRAEACATGARPAGWKIAFTNPTARRQRGIESSLIGYLLEDRFLPADQPASLDGAIRPGAEVELAFQMGTDLPAGADRQTAARAISSVSAAIELIDVDPVHGADLTEVIAHNISQRAVIIGRPHPWDERLLDRVAVQATHNGVAAHPPVPVRPLIQDAGALVLFVAEAVATLGETLRAGEYILSGMLAPGPAWIAPDDRLDVDYGPLGRLDLTFA